MRITTILWRLVSNFTIFYHYKLLTCLKQKEIEKKNKYKLYSEKYHNNVNLCEKVKQKKDKLDIIKRKNENLKIIICKLMKEKNIFKENW